MTAIQKLSVGARSSLLSLRRKLDAIELVHDHVFDYTQRDGQTIDRDYVKDERVTTLMKVLTELDGVVKDYWETELIGSDQLVEQLLGDAVGNARALAAAIRQILGEL